jgi:formate hydrogenlyase subunit 3/multisubunit Na+/H+ antiporter MnhD subunit
MSSGVLAALLGWLAALAIFLGFIALLRYIDHRERMAMIARGIDPYRLRRRRRGTGVLRAGLIVGMVGLALTIGLYPLGYILPAVVTATPLHVGPWLLPGLIPLGVGGALVISYYLSQDSRPPDDNDSTKRESFRNVTENGHQESRPPSSLL